MRSLVGPLVIVLVLAGCGSPGPNAVDEIPEQDAHTVENCGRTQNFTHPPQRVVSLNQHATEILVALGLGDRLVGTAYPDDHAPPPEIAAEYERIPMLSEQYPSIERILGAEPDLVVGGYATAFDEAEGRGRGALEELGIPTLLLAESCADGPVGMDTLLTDIRMFGGVLNLRADAERLGTDIQRRVRVVTERVADEPPVDVFVYDSGEQAAKTLGGNDVGDDALTRAGGRNVFGDVGGTFPDVSWEQVAARQPEAVVLVDYLGAPADGKRGYLRAHPVAADTPAVRDGRFSTIPLVELTEGIRFPDAVERLAEDLHGPT